MGPEFYTQVLQTVFKKAIKSSGQQLAGGGAPAIRGGARRSKAARLRCSRPSAASVAGRGDAWRRGEAAQGRAGRSGRRRGVEAEQARRGRGRRAARRRRTGTSSGGGRRPGGDELRPSRCRLLQPDHYRLLPAAPRRRRLLLMLPPRAAVEPPLEQGLRGAGMEHRCRSGAAMEVGFERTRCFFFASLTGAGDRKSTRLNSSHITRSRMPSSA